MKLEPQDFEILKPIIEQSIIKTLTNLQEKEYERKIFNFTQAAKEIGKSYNFTRNLVNKGFLKTTIDNEHITGKQINEYLGEN